MSIFAAGLISSPNLAFYSSREYASCVLHTHFFSKLHTPNSGLGGTGTAQGAGKNTGINYLQKISGGRRKGEENTQIREWEKSILQISHH